MCNVVLYRWRGSSVRNNKMCAAFDVLARSQVMCGRMVAHSFFLWAALANSRGWCLHSLALIALYDVVRLAGSTFDQLSLRQKQRLRSLAGGLRLICNRRRWQRSARGIALRTTMGNVIHNKHRSDVAGTIFASPCAAEIVAPVEDSAKPTSNTARADRLSQKPGFKGHRSLSLAIEEQACHRSDMHLSVRPVHTCSSLTATSTCMLLAILGSSQERERGEESLSLRRQEDLHYCTIRPPYLLVGQRVLRFVVSNRKIPPKIDYSLLLARGRP